MRPIYFIKVLAFKSYVSKKEELIKLAHDSNPRVRAAAIRELGLVTDGSLAPVLLDALEDPAWEVRVEAVTSLANQGTPVVIPALQPRLEDDAVQVRQVTRDAIRVLRQKQRMHHLPREVERLLPPNTERISWPAWMGTVEFSFALVAAIFMLLSTIQFLTKIVWADSATSGVLWTALLLCVIVGVFLFVFVVSGILQVHLRLKDVFSLIKAKPWRRLVEIIFVCDVVGWFINGFVGDIIFLVALSAGMPLSIAFIASELWAFIKKRQSSGETNP
jgi:hypothetical protein